VSDEALRVDRHNGLVKGDVELVRLVKQYGDVAAVDDISLNIAGGEFFSLLGPSGCGKTSTLRLIAGFERPTSGQVLLNGVDVAHTPAHKRNVNTVFQSYALFPHLTVRDNVAFGLRFKEVDRRSVNRMVGDALALVQMDKFGKRKPAQLSGGQQQRVALARALVLSPDVLLLDEPLGALDAKLRKALQIELKSLQETVGITFIYVTHDQEEALTMSDRMAVMADGRIQQVGAPRQIYEEPDSAYVADFLGTSNLVDATSDGNGGILLGSFRLRAGSGRVQEQGPVKVLIRPERVHLRSEGDAHENCLPGVLERLVYLGSATQMIIRLATGDEILAVSRAGEEPAEMSSGTAVTVHLPAESLRVLTSSVGSTEMPTEVTGV
jgi:spermidine/putrescine transport system ATP-binding protein